MDPSSKKRKSDDDGTGAAALQPGLAPEVARKVLEPLTEDQLRVIVAEAMCHDAGVLDAVRAVADRDLAQRKLFVRGLGCDTASDRLRSIFASFGDLEEAVVIHDRATGWSKGYGFVIYSHIDGAFLALKEPSKKIDGRITIAQLAAAGFAETSAPGQDVSLRKIYVGSVPADMTADRLLAHFSSYGEIQEGPIGLDKKTGKSRGFALFVYKTAEAARSALVDPVKTIDGRQVFCKLADWRKGKPTAPGTGDAAPVAPVGVGGPQSGARGDAYVAGAGGLSVDSQFLFSSSLSSQYGGPSGISSVNSYSGLGILGASALGGVGALGLSSSSVGGTVAGNHRSGFGDPYGYSSQYAGHGTGGCGGPGMGSSLHLMPPSSVGMPSGGYLQSGDHYALSPSAYQKLAGSSSGPRHQTGGGMYHSMLPYNYSG